MGGNMPEIQNRFLRSWSPDQLQLLGDLGYVTMRRGQIVYRQGELVSHLIFMDTGLTSTLLHLSSRQVVDIWPVAGQGIIGTHTLLQRRAESLFEYRTRIEGSGWRVRREVMHEAMSKDFSLAQQMQDVIRLTLAGMAQMAACRAVHNIDQRLARMLLSISARLGSARVPLSRGTLAQMLATHRGNLYERTAKLRGIVTFDADAYEIHDATALEALACGCFRKMYSDRENVIGLR
jgi:CRP-like cAMP-binding protein